MKNKILYSVLVALFLTSCQTEILDPSPVDILTDDLVFKRASDLPSVRIGLYNAFRSVAEPTVQAGDFTADHIQHQGTFTDYQELGTKQITPANGVVASLWSSVFRSIYMSNFVLERLANVQGIREDESKTLAAEAKFLRGMANFIGAYSFGGVPKVTSTDLAANKNIARSSRETILASVLEDFQAALADLPATSATAAYLNKNAARAALARYYLYQKNWVQAEVLASQVIAITTYQLVPYEDVVTRDFNKESIFEVGYTLFDYSGNLNNLFVSRREVIPSNQLVQTLTNRDAGMRQVTIRFDATKQKGSDNGWVLRKYGTRDDSNRNFVIFRLAEMYLIRAEARANQNKIAGTTGALNDINILRTRAADGLPSGILKPTTVASASQTEALNIIEKERVYELSFEGHRWYDLVRTSRAQAVMSAFSPNWNVKYEIWPLPQSELQRNTALGAQNPGY
jgi:starch-binding outer membrane protein, SusD/RagB family